jgi:putative membrane protein
MERIVRGGLAGLLATIPMTLVIALGRVAGWLHTPPPQTITARIAQRTTEAHPPRQSPGFQIVWLAAHHAYGAAGGALFAVLRPLLPRSDLAAGLLFGGAVWGVSYLGVMPALKLFPPAQDDSWRRQAVMIAAHAVYGTVLGETVRREAEVERRKSRGESRE